MKRIFLLLNKLNLEDPNQNQGKIVTVGIIVLGQVLMLKQERRHVNEAKHPKV